MDHYSTLKSSKILHKVYQKDHANSTFDEDTKT